MILVIVESRTESLTGDLQRVREFQRYFEI